MQSPLSAVGKILAFLMILGCPVAWIIWSNHTERQREQSAKAQQQAEDRQIQESVERFAGANNAVLDWRKKLTHQPTDAIYSAELVDVFRRESRPVIFFAALDDVKQSASRYTVQLHGWINLRTKFRLLLECSPEAARDFMQHAPGEASRFAIAAEVTDVSMLDVNASERGRSLVVTGRCASAIFVGSYVGDWDDMFSGS